MRMPVVAGQGKVKGCWILSWEQQEQVMFVMNAKSWCKINQAAKLVARTTLNTTGLKDVHAFNYLIIQGTIREAYEALQTTFLKLKGIGSIYTTQKTAAELSGLDLKYIDCCVDLCCCYTGKHKGLEHCPFPNCNEPWYDKNGQLRKRFQYLPIIPHLITLFLNKTTMEKMGYCHKYCEGRDNKDVTDIFDGVGRRLP